MSIIKSEALKKILAEARSNKEVTYTVAYSLNRKFCYYLPNYYLEKISYDDLYDTYKCKTYSLTKNHRISKL